MITSLNLGLLCGAHSPIFRDIPGDTSWYIHDDPRMQMALEQVSTRGLHWVSWDFASMDMSNSAYYVFEQIDTLSCSCFFSSPYILQCPSVLRRDWPLFWQVESWESNGASCSLSSRYQRYGRSVAMKEIRTGSRENSQETGGNLHVNIFP